MLENVRKCTEIKQYVGKCKKMLGNARKCQQMKENVRQCNGMLETASKGKKNEKKILHYTINELQDWENTNSFLQAGWCILLLKQSFKDHFEPVNSETKQYF